MLLVFVIVFCALIALGFGAAAAWSDYSRLTIPNLYVLFIGASFVPAFIGVKLLAPEASFFFSTLNHVLAAFFVFSLTYVLFYLKVIGGGDSKLLTAFALWTGLNGIMPFLFFMALTGGVLGLATLALKKWKPVEKPAQGSWVEKAQSGAQDVPYGVAIFVGAFVAFWQNGYIQPEALMQLASGGVGS